MDPEIIASITAVTMTCSMAFLAWLATKVIENDRKLVELRGMISSNVASIQSQAKNCEERLEWMRDLDTKMTEVHEHTLVIRTKLEDAAHV